jgi:hypothetical protein
VAAVAGVERLGKAAASTAGCSCRTFIPLNRPDWPSCPSALSVGAGAALGTACAAYSNPHPTVA